MHQWLSWLFELVCSTLSSARKTHLSSALACLPATCTTNSTLSPTMPTLHPWYTICYFIPQIYFIGLQIANCFQISPPLTPMPAIRVYNHAPYFHWSHIPNKKVATVEMKIIIYCVPKVGFLKRVWSLQYESKTSKYEPKANAFCEPKTSTATRGQNAHLSLSVHHFFFFFSFCSTNTVFHVFLLLNKAYVQRAAVDF